MGRARRRRIDLKLAWKLILYASLVSMALNLCFCADLKGPKSEKELARAFFLSRCSSCHDSDAQGDGQFHLKFVPPPANLTLTRNTPDMFLSIVANGIPGTAMPGFPIDDYQAQTVREYIASLPPETALEWELPWELENKTPDSENGSALFVTACTGCHGMAGDGSGYWAQDPRIWPKPSNFQARSSDMGRIYFMITNGRQGTMMPPQKETLPAGARWALAAYVHDFFNPESLARIQSMKDEPKARENKFTDNDKDAVRDGELGFELNCASCHNTQAKGSFLAPSLIDRKWLYGKGTDNDLFILMDKGIPGRLMPPFSALDEDIRWKIVSYIRYRGGLKDPREF